MEIREGKGVLQYLEKRGILKQCQIAKEHFLKVNFRVIDAKPRKPKALGVPVSDNKKIQSLLPKNKERSCCF